MQQLITRHPVKTSLVFFWLLLVAFNPHPWLLISEYGGFALLGVVGAIFANATGAGGGVVFVPFFNQLAFDSNTTVATSFAIQCCGMTAGAVTWWLFFRQRCQDNRDWQELHKALGLSVPFSIAGIVLAQAAQYMNGSVGEAESLHGGFGIFSILLSVAIFASIGFLKQQRFVQRFTLVDNVSIPLIALLGGIITAYLSIGVGELIAVYLIMRRFNITFSIAVAVILSAFSVWAGVLFHAFVFTSIYWPIVLFAGAGAIVGGVLAKQLVLYFSATHLKVFFAAWVFVLGVSALPF